MKTPKWMGGIEIRGDDNNIKSLGLVLAIWLFIGWVFDNLVPGDTWGSYMFAAMVWTVILFFTRAINGFVVYIRANHALVYEDPLIEQRKLTTDAELVKPQPTKQMRAIIGPRIAGKLPWQKTVGGVIVNLSRSISLGGKLEAQTKNGIKVFINWQMYLSPIAREDCLINLVRSNEENIAGEFEAIAKAYLLHNIKSVTYDEFFLVIGDDYAEVDGQKIPRAQASLRNGFKGLFGGPDKLVAREIENGMYTGEPFITEIIPDPDYQAAVQARAVAEQVKGSIEVYTSANVPPDIAANMASGDRGKPMPAVIYRIEGLPPGASFWPGGGPGGKKK